MEADSDYTVCIILYLSLWFPGRYRAVAAAAWMDGEANGYPSYVVMNSSESNRTATATSHAFGVDDTLHTRWQHNVPGALRPLATS